MVQSVECRTLGFSWGHELGVVAWSPTLGSALSLGVCLGLSLLAPSARSPPT